MEFPNSESGKACIYVNTETRQAVEQFLSPASDSIFLLFKEVNQQAQNNTDQYGSTEWEVKRPVFSPKSKVKWIFNAILFYQ